MRESYSGRLRQPSKLEREITPWVRIPLLAQYGDVAQWLAQVSYKHEVVGSSPTFTTYVWLVKWPTTAGC
jgi:hypothetical protein